MADRKLMGLLVAVVVLAGCIPLSVHPFYRSRDVEFAEWLLGEWGDEEEEGAFTFERADDEAYRLTVHAVSDDAQERWIFEAHLFELGDRLFLDLVRADSFDDVGERIEVDEAKLDRKALDDFVEPLCNWAFFQIPAHTFVQIKRDGDTLRYAWMDADWLEDALEAKKVRIDHVKLADDRILLTASTCKLRRFVKKHAGNPDAYGDWDEVCKKDPEAGKCSEPPAEGAGSSAK